MQTMSTAAIAGFLLGASLIVAIGAQNAFVLRQGLLRQHVFTICTICALSDAVLIGVGVAGFGTVVRQVEWLLFSVTLGGALFLGVYGFLAFRRAVYTHTLHAAGGGSDNLRATVLTCLALTFLNPHVYFDTIRAGGMNPALMVDKYIKTGELVELIPKATLNKSLYWHYSRLIAEPLKNVTNKVICSALLSG